MRQQPYSSRERLKAPVIYAHSIETDFHTVPVKVHRYYDQQMAVLDENALLDDIQRHEQQLLEIAKQKQLKPSLEEILCD